MLTTKTTKKRRPERLCSLQCRQVSRLSRVRLAFEIGDSRFDNDYSDGYTETVSTESSHPPTAPIHPYWPRPPPLVSLQSPVLNAKPIFHLFNEVCSSSQMVSSQKLTTVKPYRASRHKKRCANTAAMIMFWLKWPILRTILIKHTK